jgi:hypothetical protein
VQGNSIVKLTTLFLLGAVTLADAQIGWSKSETARVPPTDFSVTGPPPYRCLSLEEQARLDHDPVHQFQVWANRQLEEHLDWTGRLQTYDNCAEACAAVPLEAQAIVEIKTFVHEVADNRYARRTWPLAGTWSVWEEEVDSSRIVGNKRLICGTLHSILHNSATEGYFIVYFDY